MAISTDFSPAKRLVTAIPASTKATTKRRHDADVADAEPH